MTPIITPLHSRDNHKIHGSEHINHKWITHQYITILYQLKSISTHRSKILQEITQLTYLSNQFNYPHKQFNMNSLITSLHRS